LQKVYIRQLIPVGVLIFLLLIPNMLIAMYGTDFDSASVIKRISYILLSCIILLSPLVFLRPRYFFLILSIFAIAAPFEIVAIFLYRTSINAGLIFAIVNTNIRESLELLKGIFPLVISGLIYISLYLIIAIKWIPSRLKLDRKVKLTLGFLFTITILLMWVRDLRIARTIIPYARTAKIWDMGTSNFLNKFSKIFPYSIAIQSFNAISNEIKINSYSKSVGQFRFGVTKQDTLKVREKYVLVIGETSRSQSWSLYGYERNTNPCLSRVNNLKVFKNFAATGNLTSISIPLILTRATPDSFQVSYTEKTIVSAFKECGFSTYWISNQGVFDNSMARFLMDVDRVYNLNSRFDFKGNYDENVMPFLDSIFKRNEQKQFIVVNLMGSHFRYNYRYPESFSVFKPCFEGAFDYTLINPRNKERLTNIYDNSILYGDYVVSQIIKKLDSQKVLSYMVFLSDHGENLFDDSNGYFGHGSEKLTPYEIIVPFIVWTSDLYRNVYPDKERCLELNKDKRSSTSSLFNSLLDGANVKYSDSRRMNSFFGCDYNEDSIRKVLIPTMKVVEFDRK